MVLVDKVVSWLGGLPQWARLLVSLGSALVAGGVVMGVSDKLVHSDVVSTILGIAAAWGASYGLCRLAKWVSCQGK